MTVGEERVEAALVACLADPRESDNEVARSLEELGRLVETAGGVVVGSVVQRREAPDSATYFGRGKVEELKGAIAALGATMLVVEREITPTQQRHLEDALGVKVVDRTALILDIFARHATTVEGKVQVELAQLNYLRPRLVGRGVELSRLGGGIGTRGPGETKLEVDRRRINDRIAHLRRKLKAIEKHRALSRSRRLEAMFTVGLVGYTNAGKSSLLNALTKARVLADDRLFATLDPTARRLYLPPEVTGSYGFEVVVIDTVGFIENLPHQLVAAFHSTLEEATSADLLLHVVDAVSDGLERRVRVVERTLEEIGAAGIPRLTVLNKADLLDEGGRARLRASFPDGLPVSAMTGEGLEELKRRVARIALASGRVRAPAAPDVSTSA